MKGICRGVRPRLFPDYKGIRKLAGGHEGMAFQSDRDTNDTPPSG